MTPLRALGARIAAWARGFAGGENRAAAVLLVIGFAITVAALVFFRFVAREIADSDTQKFDEHVLQAIAGWKDGLRTVDVGPLNARTVLDEFFRDVTALGGPAGLTLLTLFTTVYLFLAGRREDSLLTIVAAGGAITINVLLKHHFERPRPIVVEHAQVFTSSFPSGHSMTSMAIYLTLGVLLARLAPTWSARVFATASTVFIALLIASSRMYEGVHYLTDVSAGASLGLAWSLSVLCAAEVFRRRRGHEGEGARA
jgi:undecaprenyl-diphosphatase